MFDPAALGTLIIGLDSVSRDEQLELIHARPQPRSRGLTRAARVQLATALRRVAEALEPRPAPASEIAR